MQMRTIIIKADPSPEPAMNLPPLPATPAATRDEPVAHDLPLAFDSRELLRGVREVLIRHAGQVYRLRHTRNDKLILVK